jgi:hypothetical protein
LRNPAPIFCSNINGRGQSKMRRHQPIEFSGDIAQLAVTLRIPVDQIIDALDALIRAGHLERLDGNTWLLKPAR